MYSYESKDPRVIQGSEDVPALRAELAAEDWCGPTMSILRDELWLYGWDVLRGLIRTHRVPGKYQPHLSELDWALLHDSSADREEVCLETLGHAVPKFIDSLRRGAYDPSQSSMPPISPDAAASSFVRSPSSGATSAPKLLTKSATFLGRGSRSPELSAGQ